MARNTHDDESGFADGTLVPVVHDEHPNTYGEELLHACCSNLGVNRAMAMAIIAWADEHMPSRSVDNDGTAGIEAVRRAFELIERGFDVLISYQSSQKTAHEVRMSTRIMALALDFSLAAGAKDPTEIARQCGLTKAAGQKCFDLFNSEKLKLPLRAGQRGAQARANMSAKRNEQLTSAER